ncbi:MAG: hypothetical protein A2W11_06185 [Ignavibacteria bacterium RBG_16_35_7]|nr:MAG: hypothetical protein A2W11_06185 [Ignavibacteria bacterium RBG_16_35_7]
MDLKKYDEMLKSFGIVTILQKAAFYAQIDHESCHFTRLSENLNYSAQGLANTWATRYAKDPKAKEKTPNGLALKLHRKPEAIANNAYANRNGNGSEASGDGWCYRGSGYIQLTGKDNHLAFASHVGKSLSEVSDYMRTEVGAMESAAWFWKVNKLNSFADSGNIDAVSRKVNGGKIGLKERNELYVKYLKELNGNR